MYRKKSKDTMGGAQKLCNNTAKKKKTKGLKFISCSQLIPKLKIVIKN